ncbi:MAG: hypothetical protein NWP80_02010, partial [Candidatus Gracilibacteria bacterium]|nr:hypothetical protein [Candidatus Gracilibacteria bacterium]
VMVGGFYAITSVNLGKTKIIESSTITQDSFYFGQKLFEEIKFGGTIDYEEYFNRKVIGTTTQNGHYKIKTGFGNFGQGGSVGTTSTPISNYGNSFYYCRSGNGTSMGVNGCYNNTFNTTGASLGNSQQRFGQYAFQFIDYNSNESSNMGDENGDLNIRGDDDDENLGEGPIVFDYGIDVKELYLISGDRKKRTYFRWKWKQDPNKPSYIGNCNITSDNNSYSDGCIGTIQILKLVGEDWGVNHLKSGTGFGDGIIDTWLLDSNFYGNTTDIISGSVDMEQYWVDLFPDTLSVKSFEVYPYPNINRNYSWKNIDNQKNINPYVQIKLNLIPSWKKRVTIKGELPEIQMNKTINLSDYFSK